MAARNGRSDAAAMRQDQVALQSGCVLGRNLNRGEFAKAGIDPVDRIRPRDGLSNARMGAFNCGVACGV